MAKAMESLTNRYLHVMESGQHSDITLIVGKKKVAIKAHKVFLFGSPYFEAELLASSILKDKQKCNSSNDDGSEVDLADMIERNVQNLSCKSELENENNKDNNVLVIEDDVEEEDFRLFLKFMYGGIPTITVDQALPLLLCGTKFMVPSLVAVCEAVLNETISAESALTLFQQSLRYKNDVLQKSTLDFICKNARKIVTRAEFAELGIDALQLILTNDGTQVDNELQIFEAAIKWAKSECGRKMMDENDPKCIRSVLEPVLKFIRFPQMTASEFVLKVARLKILTSDELVDILLYFHVSQDQRGSLPSEFFISTPRKYKNRSTTTKHNVDSKEYSDMSPQFRSAERNTSRLMKEACYKLRQLE